MVVVRVAVFANRLLEIMVLVLELLVMVMIVIVVITVMVVLVMPTKVPSVVPSMVPCRVLIGVIWLPLLVSALVMFGPAVFLVAA